MFGVKGPSLLSREIDLDYMHAVLEGLTRWMLLVWLDSSNNQEAFYIGRHTKQIDTAHGSAQFL